MEREGASVEFERALERGGTVSAFGRLEPGDNGAAVAPIRCLHRDTVASQKPVREQDPGVGTEVSGPGLRSIVHGARSRPVTAHEAGLAEAVGIGALDRPAGQPILDHDGILRRSHYRHDAPVGLGFVAPLSPAYLRLGQGQRSLGRLQEVSSQGGITQGYRAVRSPGRGAQLVQLEGLVGHPQCSL